MTKEVKTKKGCFGEFGGQYVPEILVGAVQELERAFKKFKASKKNQKILQNYLKEYAGRPTPLTHASNISKVLKLDVYLKREDLLHTGAHKINNTLGQALLAKAMGKKRIVAETGAGQHGVATATACALLKLPCVVYMGKKDVERQALNVYRMQLMGAKVIPVESGSKTLKDAINEAIRDWICNVNDTHYIIGSVVGPSPYPEIVRDFQSVIGKETRQQTKGKKIGSAVACVGGGSNAMGMFHPFAKTNVKLFGIEAAGSGVNTKKHSATLTKGSLGIFHGFKSYVLQSSTGQIQEAHSISAGLDYPGVGPEHAYFKTINRVTYDYATDQEALEGFQFLSHMEGIIPALETAHAIGWLMRSASKIKKFGSCVVCLSGRGDKDVNQISKVLKISQ